MGQEKERNICKVIFLVITGVLGFIFLSMVGMMFFSMNFSGYQFSADDIIGLTVVSCILLFVVLAIFLMAYFVYKDSKKRGMNPWLWLLIVVYAQPPIGFIIYLVIRQEKQVKKSCNQCGKQVENEYSVCPHCGAELKEKCPKCHKSVQEQWNVCPYCETRLKEESLEV